MDAIDLVSRTKLFRPPVVDDYVVYHRLEHRFAQITERPIVLVVAPAGYGKSSLVSHCVEKSGLDCNWVSLDEQDNDVREFLRLLAAGWQECQPGLAEILVRIAAAQHLPSGDCLARELCTGFDSPSDKSILVLDDYHTIGKSTIHEVVGGILTHLSQYIKVVILSRRSPSLRLARLRSQNRLLDLRMQDLSFRRQETREFVSAIANCELDDQSLDHLQEHTEGWPAGLRMILLAAETHKDMASFIRGLTDDPWQIQQYLLEEVLERLSDPIGDMIVRAAMVDSFSAELLNALVSDGTTVVDVTGSTLIETIQRTGLFCVPLDDTGTWFRFHHQFQEILRRRADAELTDDEARLVHERGGEWFDQSGLTARAVHHYLLAERGDLAGDVVSRDGLAALNKIDFPAVDAALALLPDACIQGSVELKILLAHAATAAGRYSQLMSVVQSLRTALESDRSISKEQSSRIMVLQASLDFLAGNHDEATTTLLREVEQLPVHYTFEHSAALLLLAGSLQTRGNRASALKWLFGALETAPSGVSYYRRRVLVAMCHVYWGCGDLAELVDVASTLLRKYGTEKCAYITVRACWFKAAAQYLRDDVDEAVETLQLVVRNRWWPHLHSYANCTQVLTSAYMAQGDFDKARDTAAELVAQEIEGSATYFLDDALAVQAEVELASGRVANAFRWAMEYENPQLNTPFGFKIPALSAARILLKSASGEGLRKADALIREHELFLDLINSRRFLIEALVLRAIYCAQTGDIDTALERLIRAISLAEPGGFVRVFVDMGPELLPLLSRLSISDTLVIKFVGRIIRALESSDFTARTFGQRDGANRSVLPEYLSRRELEVLRLLSRHLTNKEIGERLFISPATVKRHAHNVYQKLNVANRREAVAKASGLGIVD